MSNKIYVFETTIDGRHNKGNALRAFKEYGAEYGVGYGLQGSSFAIPVSDETSTALSISKIKKHIESFIKFAKYNSHFTFEVTRIGCRYYDDRDIAPLFKDAPQNCLLPVGWRTFSTPNQKIYA